MLKKELFLPVQKKQFLFSDSQRKTLGLKTYEHIRAREKYYLFRLIANSESTIILCINNIEKDISISSFVEDLRVQVNKNNNIEYSYREKDCFGQRFGCVMERITRDCPVEEKDVTGLIIPFEKEVFFKDGTIKISPSSFNVLKKNPIDYYLKNILKLTPLSWKPENIITPLAFGIIFHEIMNRVFENIRLNDRLRNKIVFKRGELDSLIESAVTDIISAKDDFDMIYQIPANMSLDFYRKHILPFITDSVRIFINYLIEFMKVSADNQPEIFIEGKFAPEIEGRGITLINNDRYEVVIRGRADLILYSKYYNAYYIIDFKSSEQKTGSVKDYKAQLEFYRHLYFSKNSNIKSPDRIVRMLMFLMDHSKVINDKDEETLPEVLEKFFSEFVVSPKLILPDSTSNIDKNYLDLYRF